AHAAGPEFEEFPLRFHDGAGQLSAHVVPLLRVDLEGRAAVDDLAGFDQVDAVDPLQLARYFLPWTLGGYQHRLEALQAALKLVRRALGDDLSGVDHHHALARLRHFGQDVRGERRAVLARKSPDQLARPDASSGTRPGCRP